MHDPQLPVAWARFEAMARCRWIRLAEADWRFAAGSLARLATRIHAHYGESRAQIGRHLRLLMFLVRREGGHAPVDESSPVPGADAATTARAPEPPQRRRDDSPARSGSGRVPRPFALATGELAPGVVQIQIRGALDARSHHALAEVFAQLIRTGIVRLVVDCSAVESISSAGAAACVVAAGHAQERGGNLVFLRPSAPVRSLFDTLGLGSIVPQADDLATALAHLPEPPPPPPIGSNGFHRA